MLFRIMYSYPYDAFQSEARFTGATIEEAVQKFLRRFPEAFVHKVEFIQELELE